MSRSQKLQTRAKQEATLKRHKLVKAEQDATVPEVEELRPSQNIAPCTLYTFRLVSKTG